MTKMQNLQPKNFNLDKLDEELVCMAMIHALPESYVSFTSSVLLLSSLSKTALQDAFQAEETTQCQCAIHMTTNNDVTLLAPAVNHTKNMKMCRFKPSVLCDICDKTGHLHNCYTFAQIKKQQKEKQVTWQNKGKQSMNSMQETRAQIYGNPYVKP